MDQLMSPDISKLAEALAQMQGSVKSIKKNMKANVGKYSYAYADLPAIWDAIREPLVKNGLSISQLYSSEGNILKMITLLIHSSGQWLKSTLCISIAGLKIQEVGSAMTYNRRYALSAILGISTDEDEDGAMANQVAPVQHSEPVVKNNFTSDEATEILLPEEYAELIHLISEEDEQYQNDLLGFFSRSNKKEISSFRQLPRKDFEKVMKSIRRRREERFKKEEQRF